jgi:dCTP deaminase
MAVYSDIQIRQAIEEGHIVCHPFSPTQVNRTSLVVTLGNYYYRIDSANERAIYNPFSKEDVERFFDGPYKALPHSQWCALNGFKPIDNVPLEYPVISLGPGERILAHTHEFVGILSPGSLEIKPHSNWAQNGLEVGLGAGWVDPGVINRLPLTIQNHNERETILLPIGENIALAIFHDTGIVDKESGTQPSDDNKEKTRISTDLDGIIKVWSPDMILPRAYEDKRITRQKIEGLIYD